METSNAIVLRSADDVRVRSNARTFEVNICAMREKMKKVNVKAGWIVAMALDKAEIDSADPDSLDIRVNGRKASLLQVLGENDTIYLAPKVAGA